MKPVQKFLRRKSGTILNSTMYCFPSCAVRVDRHTRSHDFTSRRVSYSSASKDTRMQYCFLDVYARAFQPRPESKLSLISFQFLGPRHEWPSRPFHNFKALESVDRHFQQHIVCWSLDFEALKLWEVPTFDPVCSIFVSYIYRLEILSGLRPIFTAFNPKVL